MELKSRSSSSRVVVVVMVVMLGKEVFGMVGGHSVWKAVPWPTAPIGMKSWFGSKSRSIFWIGEAWPGWLLSSIASPLTTDSWCAGMGCKRAIQAKRQPRSFVRKVSGCLLGDPGRREGENMCTRKSKSRKFLCNYMVWCGMVAMNVNRKGVIHRNG